jgi:hypothetical protein
MLTGRAKEQVNTSRGETVAEYLRVNTKFSGSECRETGTIKGWAENGVFSPGQRGMNCSSSTSAKIWEQFYKKEWETATKAAAMSSKTR